LILPAIPKTNDRCSRSAKSRTNSSRSAAVRACHAGPSDARATGEVEDLSRGAEDGSKLPWLVLGGWVVEDLAAVVKNPRS
jgi:hypothetical protein